MLSGILRFEWRYHTRQITFAAVVAVLALLSVTLVGTGYGPEGVNINSPYIVMQSLGLLSLAAVFVLTIFCANAALRDVEHGMTEIVFTTPIGKPRYLFGRFAGALLAGVTVMAIAAVVLMLAPLVMKVEPGRLGAVRPIAYVWALLVLVLPNLVLVGALLFAVATLTRNTLATYVGGVAIYALYMVCALLIDSPLMAGVAPPTPEGLARAALLDPFGLSAFFEQTRYWTPAERDVRLLSLSGHVLLNRAIWLGLSVAVLALVYHRFAFRVTAGARTARTRGVKAESAPPVMVYRAVTPSASSARALWPALSSAVRLELRHVLRGWTFLALLALWVFVAGMEAVAQLGGGEYGTHVLPTTGLMLEAMQLPLLLIGTVTIVYYAAEVAWRERLVGIDALVDSTPASSAVFYFAKAAALCALPMLMALAAIVVGTIVQLANGQPHVQLGLYLALLWYGGVPLALFAIGALAMQTLVPNRWLGMMGGLALAVVARRGEVIGLEHPMLRFGAGPSAPYSTMDGFGPVPPSFAVFMLYWAAAAAVIACISWGVWRRGLDVGVRARLAALPRTWGRRGARIATLCVTLLVIAGAALFWQTNIAHAWEGSNTRATWSANYERAYRHIEGQPQPSVIAVRTNVDLYPSRRRADIAGTYLLENRTTHPIDTAWVSVPRDVARDSVTISGAMLVQHETRFGMYVFRFAHPLEPGARADLTFAVSLDRGGIRATRFDYDVAGNGSFITSGGAYPALGYRPGYELSNPAPRREHGLTAPASTIPPLSSADSVRTAGRSASWLTIDATISTSADQTALGPGKLERAWESGGRRHFHYVMDQPVTPRFAFVSARYAVRRVRHGGVDVEVWYHPADSANVTRILNVTTRSLDVLESRFGAYPHAVLRVVEVPAWSSFGGFALPSMVLFTEDRGFRSDPRADDVDLITRRVAHEVAHQWWGHKLDAADVAGASTLTETLAKYSEQLVVADMHGADALPAMLAFDEDRYLAGRAQESANEPTLLEATDQAYLYYGKGAVIMNALRDLLGAAAVDRALGKVMAVHAGPRGAATTLDLRDAVRVEAATSAQRTLVDEWLGERTVYDLRVDSAYTTTLENGRFRTAVWITAAKTVRRGTTDVPLSMEGEAIDVAVYDGNPQTGRRLYAGKHTVTEGRIALSLDLAARPAFVVVDPFVRRIDRDRTDNRKRIAISP
jgi:ABC-2 type transport system permease protein